MENQQFGMKNKTIKKIMNKKIESWLDSIDCEDVKKIAKDNVIVTGGSIASMAMGDRVNDFDVYMRTMNATIAIAEYYVKKGSELTGHEMKVVSKKRLNIKGEEEDRVIVFVESSGVAEDHDHMERNEEDNVLDESLNIDNCNEYRPVFISENAITLSGSIQIVIRFFGEPEKIHDNFDYLHAMCYFDYAKQSLSIPIEAARSMMSKTLYYKGSLYPVCSLFRMRKFIKRGWKISAGEILKIAIQISSINLLDREVLREQLTGVDQLYFNYLYDAIAKNEGDISTEYVIEIIDRIFGDMDC